MPEIYRRFFVALKRKPQNIPIVAVALCFVWYSFNLSLVSFTTTRLQAPNMGLTGFVIMLLSVLAIVCGLNAFPYRKKVNVPMLVLLFVMLAIIIVCDIYYLSCVSGKLAAKSIGEVENEPRIIATWRMGNLNSFLLLLIVIWGVIGTYFISFVIRSAMKEGLREAIVVSAVIVIIAVLVVLAFLLSRIVLGDMENMLKTLKTDETMRKVLVTRQVMRVHLGMAGISTVLVAALPVYRKWIRKIDTSIEVEENTEMEAIDISGE